MTIHIVFDENDKCLWAWVSVNIVMSIFFILFAHIYWVGKYNLKDQQQTHHPHKSIKISNLESIDISSNDYKIFERLRLLCCFILIFYSLWPFQFYFSKLLNDFEYLFIVSLSSLADVGVTFIISVIAHRTITSYHKIVHGLKLPSYYNFILFTYVFINGLCSCFIEMLSFGLHSHKYKIFDIIYNRWAYVFFSFQIILFLTLFRFLLKIVIIFSKIYKYEKSRGIKTDAKEVAMKRLYQRMVYLCGGLLIYCFLLIGCYTYFFLAGGKDVTNQFWWIIIHELGGHMVLFSTFYAYLRIERVNLNSSFSNNISGNKNIGAKVSVTRSRASNSNVIFNNSYNHRIQQVQTKYTGSYKKGQYYQNSNDDFFADDDMSDLRRVHRGSQSDQTEIMSISGTDEAIQHYNSYNNSLVYSMMPQSAVPPVHFTISPNDGNENLTDTKIDYKYENFII